MKNYNYIRALQFCVENGVILEQYELEQLEYLYEGANIDIVKVGWATFKAFKSGTAEVNDLIDQRDYNGAAKAMAKLKKTCYMYQKQFETIDASNVGSKTFGALASVGINALQALFPLTSKLAGIKGKITSGVSAANKAAYYTGVVGNVANGAAAPAVRGLTPIGKGISKGINTAATNVAKGIGKNAKIAAGAAKAAKPLATVAKTASKAAPYIAAAITATETIIRTVKDYKQMQKDAKEGKITDNNLFKSKILQLYKTMNDELDELERYLKICARSQEEQQNPQAQQQQKQVQQKQVLQQRQQVQPQQQQPVQQTQPKVQPNPTRLNQKQPQVAPAQ